MKSTEFVAMKLMTNNGFILVHVCLCDVINGLFSYNLYHKINFQVSKTRC